MEKTVIWQDSGELVSYKIAQAVVGAWESGSRDSQFGNARYRVVEAFRASDKDFVLVIREVKDV